MLLVAGASSLSNQPPAPSPRQPAASLQATSPSNQPMTFRRDLMKILTVRPRSVSSLARQLELKRAYVEDDLRHMIRSARAAGHEVVVEPARCRSCGFTFGEEKLSKPGKCPQCRSTWLYEAQVRVAERA